MRSRLLPVCQASSDLGVREFYIKAAEGKWKGWYLNTSDRAFKDGPSFGYLLEMGKQPQTFYVYQVSK